MTKVRMIKYTKPYLVMILASIALLFAQANCDLALPDYLSDIVNVGIQQGGVKNAVPEAIREREMNRTLMFVTPANQTAILAAYTLIRNATSDAAQYTARYPALLNQSIYVLTNSSEAEITLLNPIMARPLLAVYAIEQVMANDTLLALIGTLLFGSPFSSGTNLFTLLSYQFAALSNYIMSKINPLDDRMAIQGATLEVRAEYGALGMDVTLLQNNYMFSVGGMMVLLTLLSVLCTIAVGYLAAKTATGMSRDIRRDIFKKVAGFSNTEFDSFSTASLIIRSTNDITQVQMAMIMVIRLVFFAPILGVGAILRAMGKASGMWWLLAVAVSLLISIIIVVFYIAYPKFKSIQKLVDRLNLVARESLTGMMVVRAFNKQKFEETRFDKANVDLTRVSLFVNRVMVVMLPLMMFLMNVLLISIIWVGAHEVSNATMQVGDIMAFMQYAMQIVISFLMLSLMFIILPRASVSANRIAEVLRTEPTIRDPEEPKRFNEPFKGTVEFRNVSFRYAGAAEDVLHDISFVARPGQTTAFIGATGSGKSTIMNLIPRFYEVTSGAVLVDGVDIREVTQHDMRSKIGYVPQKSALFSGTIASNMLFADENASEDTVQSAIKIAQVTEFVNANREGMATEIAQDGMNVSGGQKQRLSIARALVKKAPIYILDDSFSNLDFKTDAALRRAFKETTAKSTLIIVTQRVSTIKNADQIIVLHEGKIVGKGTHSELMQNCVFYKEIVLSQMNLEESV